MERCHLLFDLSCYSFNYIAVPLGVNEVEHFSVAFSKIADAALKSAPHLRVAVAYLAVGQDVATPFPARSHSINTRRGVLTLQQQSSAASCRFMNRDKSSQGTSSRAPTKTSHASSVANAGPSSSNVAGKGPRPQQSQREMIKLSLDQWTNQLAPLSDSDKASVSKLGEWLDRNAKAKARAASVSVRDGSSGSPGGSAPTSGPAVGEVAESKNTAAEAQSNHTSKDARSLDASSSSAALPAQPLSDAASYQTWLSSLEQHLSSTAELSHQAALSELTQAREAVDVILADIERAAVHVSELRAGCQYVEEGTSALRDEAESHLEKLDRLHELAEGLALRRSYFALLPSITRFLSSPSPDLSLVLQPEFLHNLDKLDVALRFVAAHEHYKDAPLYRMRFEQCVVRAASLIRMWVQRWSGEWATKTQEGLKEWQANRIRKGKEKERPEWAQQEDPRMVSTFLSLKHTWQVC